MKRPIITAPADREVLLGLWAVPGLGNAQLDHVWEVTSGRLASLWSLPVASWLDDFQLQPASRAFLSTVWTLESLVEAVRARAAEGRMRISFEGDPDYPERLLEIPDRPPVLFHWGQLGVPRTRVAMVGSRKPENGFGGTASKLATELSGAGLGIISGAAVGIDTLCHEAALSLDAETWAFLACSLDRLDAHHRKLRDPILRARGMILTEYPPNTPSDRTSFPRRNRLISGAADATLILRADLGSGTLHTARHALAQGRPLLAVPGDPFQATTRGCHLLLQEGSARLCAGPDDVYAALAFVPERVAPRPPPGKTLDGLSTSRAGRRAWDALTREPQVFEDILLTTQLQPDALLCALSELEVLGVVAQHPGKAYARA